MGGACYAYSNRPYRIAPHTVIRGGESSYPMLNPLDRAKGHEVAWRQVSPVFNVARSIQGDVSFVYLIGEVGDGPIKVGLAKDPIARLRSMQTGNPRRLRLERVLFGDAVVERLLHELWEPFAIRSANSKVDAPPGTEWFRPDAREDLLPIIETVAIEQVKRVEQATGDLTFEEMERIVRDAHISHGYTAQGRDEVRRLASVGYAVSRPSRI